jgi:hypothetical protein
MADTYDFKIPDSVAPGDYIFSWSWVSKQSGQPEYYMNCAPIEVVGGGAARRDANTTTGGGASAAGSQLPDLFVANLADINECKTAVSKNLVYPDPGPNLEKLGASPDFKEVTGTNCYPKGSAGGSSNGSNSGSGSVVGGASNSSQAALPYAGSSQTASMPSAGFLTSTLRASSRSTMSSKAPSSMAKPSSSKTASSGFPGSTGSGSQGAMGGGKQGKCTRSSALAARRISNVLLARGQC